MSALPPKADMCSALAHVCFGPIADISTKIDSSFRQPRRSERLAQSGGKRGRAIDAGKMLPEMECRLQFQNPRCRGFGFFQPSELRERCRQ